MSSENQRGSLPDLASELRRMTYSDLMELASNLFGQLEEGTVSTYDKPTTEELAAILSGWAEAAESTDEEVDALVKVVEAVDQLDVPF